MRLLVLLVVLTLFAGCTSDEPSTTAPTPTPTPTPMTDAVAASVDLVREPGVGVPPTTLGIRPARLELAAGILVNLTVNNADTAGHDLVIEGLDVATENIAGGASASLLFAPSEPGTYRMYCSVGGDGPLGHAAQGMTGEVVVA